MMIKIFSWIISLLYLLFMAPMVFITYIIVGVIFEFIRVIKEAVKQVKRTQEEKNLYIEEWEQHFFDKE